MPRCQCSVHATFATDSPGLFCLCYRRLFAHCFYGDILLLLISEYGFIEPAVLLCQESFFAHFLPCHVECIGIGIKDGVFSRISLGICNGIFQFPGCLVGRHDLPLEYDAGADSVLLQFYAGNGVFGYIPPCVVPFPFILDNL